MYTSLPEWRDMKEGTHGQLAYIILFLCWTHAHMHTLRSTHWRYLIPEYNIGKECMRQGMQPCSIFASFSLYLFLPTVLGDFWLSSSVVYVMFTTAQRNYCGNYNRRRRKYAYRRQNWWRSSSFFEYYFNWYIYFHVNARRNNTYAKFVLVTPISGVYTFAT